MFAMYLNCDECRLLFHTDKMENESLCKKCAAKKSKEKEPVQ